MRDRKRSRSTAKYKRMGFDTKTEQKRLCQSKREAKRNERKKTEGEKRRAGEI